MSLNIAPLSSAAISKMNEYVNFVIDECLGDGEEFPLGTAWREALAWPEQTLVAAAIIYRAEAASDIEYRVIERGELADSRLVFVAAELALS